MQRKTVQYFFKWTYCGLVASEILANTGSSNGLLPDGTKPLHESILTNQCGVLWHSPEDIFFQEMVKILDDSFNISN